MLFLVLVFLALSEGSGSLEADAGVEAGLLPLDLSATHRSLGLVFMRAGVSGSVPSEDLYLSLSYVRTWL